MTQQEKVLELRNILREALTPLIDADYVLLDVPYYDNFGDTLIWEGTEIFLKKLPYKCLHKTNTEGYNDEVYADNVIILLQGGGNFGDLWRYFSEFRMRVIRNNPNNKIIILPQTIHYNDIEVLKSDAAFFSKHNNVTICARDNVSYSIIKNNFTNPVLLLPDMAFFIDAKKYSRGEQKGKTLFLKRNDQELKSNLWPSFIPRDADVSDWPSPDETFINVLFIKLKKTASRVDKYLLKGTLTKYRDCYCQLILKRHYLNFAVRFLDNYEFVYSTRLHVFILSFLLEKNIDIIDNSYGKNSSFYNTWLSDADNIKLIKE